MKSVELCAILVFLMSVEAKVQLIYTNEPLQVIGNRIYKQELLTNEFQDPRELVYDSSSRTLFFMYMDDKLQNSGRGSINVITKEAKKINGIAKNKATAVDFDSGDVYFGSEDGLYKYDPIDNIARNIGLYNINILKMVIRNNEIFLIDANSHMLYRVSNDKKFVFKVGNMKTVIDFDVDTQNNIHYVSMCGLFCVTNENEIVKNKDLKLVYNFLVDDDRTLGITETGLYELHCKNGTVTELSELDFFPRSIVFGDYGDLYFSNNDGIYKLRPLRSYLIYNIYKVSRNSTNNYSGRR